MSIHTEQAVMELYRLRCDNCGMLREMHSITKDAARAGGTMEGWVINRNEEQFDWCPKCLGSIGNEVP